MFAFDTLKLARDLRDNAAFSPEQAEGLAAAISTAVQDNVPAKSETAAEFASVRSEIAVLRMEVAANQRDNKAEFTAIRSEMKLLEHRMTIKLGAMLAAFAGIQIAAMRVLIH